MKTISLVAGPCSAESRTQMLDTARGLKEIGVGTLRAACGSPVRAVEHLRELAKKDWTGCERYNRNWDFGL
mgnify:CR=1 FL=1